MTAHRFILEPYKGKATRHTCPACQKQRTFARYLDSETGEHVAANVGRCNREDNCGHHYTPKQYFSANNIESQKPTHTNAPPARAKPVQPPKPASTVPPAILKGSLQGHSGNHLITYLIRLFGTEVTNQLIGRYFVGTSKHWNGATVFYQIDTKGRIRAGKIMLYSPTTGKRVKEPYNCVTWVHSALRLPDYNLRQCFFGEHLLKTEPGKPVAIVESEKTAIIASVYLPRFVWLAAGSKDGLSAGKCQALQGRKVVLYPDLNAFDKWSLKAKEMAGTASVTVSGLLERKATEAERGQGLDLADYLTRFRHTEFARTAATEPEPPESEKSENSEALKTIYFLQHQPEPTPLLTKEFYHYSYQELAELIGATGVLKRVAQYKALSKQFESCQGFVIHRCNLLRTYHNAGCIKDETAS